MVDVLGRAGAVGAVWCVAAFDSVKVSIEGDVSCAELGQYTGLSTVEFTRVLDIVSGRKGAVDLVDALESLGSFPPGPCVLLGDLVYVLFGG